MKFINYNRRNFRLFLLCVLVVLIIATLLFLNNPSNSASNYEKIIINTLDAPNVALVAAAVESIVPEKYDVHKVRTRLIKDKIRLLTSKDNSRTNSEENGSTENLAMNSPHVHIFYTAPVQWYKRSKTNPSREVYDTSKNRTKGVNIVNTAFYPALGLYEPKVDIFKRHFENIRNAGVGVVVVTFNSRLTDYAMEEMMRLAPKFNLTISFEVTVPSNRSLVALKEQLKWISGYVNNPGVYKVFSISRNSFVPLIYVSNSYKLQGKDKLLCESEDNLKLNVIDAVFVGHIRLKSHADLLRRMCFDGFYTKSPSNGATFASTWKNWSYLKSFAITYKMLFIPSVGPGFAEKNKVPKHGDIQRHRSNGRVSFLSILFVFYVEGYILVLWSCLENGDLESYWIHQHIFI